MRIVFTILLVLVLSSFGTQAHAQEWFWGVTWGVSKALGDTENFIDKESFRNFTLEGRKLGYGSHAGLGLSFGWNVLDQKVENATTSLKAEDGPAGDVTGTQLRYLNIFPLLVTGDIYIGRPYSTRIMLGVSAGAYVVERRVEMGLFVKDEDKWQFGGAPEVGIGFPLGDTTLFFLAKYHYVLESGDASDIQYATISVGLGSN